jgi:hypothetical protein
MVLCPTSGNASRKLRIQAKSIFCHLDQLLHSILSNKERLGAANKLSKDNTTFFNLSSGSHLRDVPFIVI